MRQIPRDVFVLCWLVLILPGGRAAAQLPPTDAPDGQVSVAAPVSTVPAGETELAEAEGGAEPWSLGDWASDIWYGIVQAWNTQLGSVDGRPITVGKIATVVFMLFVGFLTARILSRSFANRLLSRFGLNENAAGALQSLSFYLLLIIFAWMALRFANIPLTVFAFLGGAIAIGVGFGSQNILNNFISGLILLAERPIRLGDLIQLEDLYGNVVKIGTRSTRVRTGNNLDIVVPNSKFLETNVVNLTLGDDKYRTHVAVGVAYGSPTRDVSRLMKHVVEEHGRILDQPEPIVLFSDFGDNALIFEVHFWIKVRSIMDRLQIESDVRLRIDHLFREAGIVIAFPQRDMHFDTDRPLSVRLLPSQGIDSLPTSSQVEEAF